MNAKLIEGIKNSRMACTDQLKEIIKDAGKSLKSHGERSFFFFFFFWVVSRIFVWDNYVMLRCGLI